MSQEMSVSQKSILTKSEAPEWMLAEGGKDTGLEEVSRYVIPPRLKIVQPLSDQTLKDSFNVGDVIIQPQMVSVAPMLYDGAKCLNEGTAFHLVPLFFWAEWCIHNNIKLKGQEPYIFDRTLDPKSEVAQRAINPKLWSGPHPEKGDEFPIRYVEHLNYVFVLIGEHELAGTPIVASFFKAEHKTGRNFAGLAKLRRAPLFGCQYEARCKMRKNNSGNWFGIDISNPSTASGVSPFVQEQEHYKVYEALYYEFKKYHADEVLRVDYDENEVVQSVADTPNEF
jgi:hypothetical protein